VVAKLDAQPVADVLKSSWEDAPGPPRDSHGADESQPWNPYAVAIGSGLENASVKGGIVGSHKVHAPEETPDPGPQPVKSRFVANIVPGDAVDVGENEAPARRTDEEGRGIDFTAVLHPHQSDGARTIPSLISSLEVQCQESRHVRFSNVSVHICNTNERGRL